MMKHKLIAAGVENIRRRGHARCNEENIFTDPVYAAAFASMLAAQKSELESGIVVSSRGNWMALAAEIGGAIDALFEKIGAAE